MALLDWNAYYRKVIAEEGFEPEGLGVEIEATGEKLVTVINDANKLVEILAEMDPPGVVMMAGRGKKVKFLHSCFVEGGRAWGLQGTTSAATLLELPVSKLGKAIYLDSRVPPTIREMGACTSSEDFKQLAGSVDATGRKKSDRNPPRQIFQSRNRHPNHHGVVGKTTPKFGHGGTE